MIDLLICIIPKINPDAPTVGPAVLKAHCEAEGFSCEVVDFNIKLYNELKSKNKESLYFKDDALFALDHHTPDLTPDFEVFYNEFEYVFMDWIEFIKEKNPRVIGLSLLTLFSLSVATRLGELIRKHIPNLKILWGGAAIEWGIEVFKNRNLFDDYIYGDGEYSITEYLKGNMTYKGINSLAVNQISNLDDILLPNYDDINWAEYDDIDEDMPVYITGSRGCVKRCTFCNVFDMWPDFRYRSGKSIAKEIISIKERYNRYTFRFTDSLINGSMKAFRNLLTELIEYRKPSNHIIWSSRWIVSVEDFLTRMIKYNKSKDRRSFWTIKIRNFISKKIDYKKTNNKFGWSSQWIVRSKDQSPESDYENMKKSGCVWLEIGLESFSQDVRFHMGKKFTDEDMWWCLEQLNKYEIPHILLMITGYPTETEENHQTTLRSVKKIFELGWNKYTYFSFGNTLMLSNAQPLYKLIEDDLEYFNSNVDWKYKDNDFETRNRRFNEVNSLVRELKNKKELSWMNQRAVDNHNKRLENEGVRIT
jgi:radical SAM superfamily enzyme YgiQ (UPF0313 family)